ncbi:hypothetical protein EW146_g6040 [Bondarzewia mesenterica]|uniref:Methylosome subunit pICln n=1 Tax=Bondarzewia mesenterica TaxID=1095465 RepID=A0A4S4LPP0_9AGAM|nr:hypothetical protein EW146_g6040 [Bondarzewia mesenterica]
MPAVTLISAVPQYISSEEHRTLTGSTPASFNDIPSVLRHKEENVSIAFDPPVEAFSAEDGAQGTLYIIESVLVFMSSTGRGFQVEYPSITLHAISRAETGPFIYCQLDESAQDGQGQIAGESEEVSEMRELSIKTQNASSLEPIFESLSYCASLHPDPATDEDDLDDAFVDAGDFETFTGTEGEELSEVGRAALAHLESIIYDPHEQSRESENGAEVNGVKASHVHEDGRVSDEEEDKGDNNTT